MLYEQKINPSFFSRSLWVGSLLHISCLLIILSKNWWKFSEKEMSDSCEHRNGDVPNADWWFKTLHPLEPRVQGFWLHSDLWEVDPLLDFFLVFLGASKCRQLSKVKFYHLRSFIGTGFCFKVNIFSTCNGSLFAGQGIYFTQMHSYVFFLQKTMYGSQRRNQKLYLVQRLAQYRPINLNPKYIYLQISGYLEYFTREQ